MDPIEMAGELYERARVMTQLAVGEAKRFAASGQWEQDGLDQACITWPPSMLIVCPVMFSA